MIEFITLALLLALAFFIYSVRGDLRGDKPYMPTPSRVRPNDPRRESMQARQRRANRR